MDGGSNGRWIDRVGEVADEVRTETGRPLEMVNQVTGLRQHRCHVLEHLPDRVMEVDGWPGHARFFSAGRKARASEGAVVTGPRPALAWLREQGSVFQQEPIVIQIGP